MLLTADPAIHRTAHAQPALFAIGYALGAALIELGIHPHLLLGHSVGEFAAAVLAKALPLEAAAQLIAARGVLMQNLPDGGGMIAVRSPAEPLRTYVDAESLVGYAALNGPHSTVLSGDLTALHRIAEKVEQQGTRVRQLQVSHAFHSPSWNRCSSPSAASRSRQAAVSRRHPCTPPSEANSSTPNPWTPPTGRNTSPPPSSSRTRPPNSWTNAPLTCWSWARSPY